MNKIGRFLLPLLFPVVTSAAEEFLLPAPAAEQEELVLYSATDYEHLAPLLIAFQQTDPGVSIRVVDLNSRELYERFLAEGQDSPADLLLSSAMDLQLKLVNDGHALPRRSEQSLALPAQAHWRHELFAFTFEPVLMVFNRDGLAGREPPRSRQELLALLRREPQRWTRRIVTYDIGASGVGYLLASQDSQQGETYGRLLEAFGSLEVQLDDNSNDMLAALVRGEADIGYNLLGSYVEAAVAAHPGLVAVAPEDYTLMLMRLALISRYSPRPELAGRLLDYMLSPPGQAALGQAGLQPLLDQTRLAIQPQGPITLIPLTPALLPPLDRLDRRSFVEAWRGSMLPASAAP
ncbi:ABC transporter substrate-binding protein [Zobellella taiwanensis]